MPQNPFMKSSVTSMLGKNCTETVPPTRPPQGGADVVQRHLIEIDNTKGTVPVWTVYTSVHVLQNMAV